MRHAFALLAPSIVCGISPEFVHVRFDNSGAQPLSLQWISPEGQYMPQGALPVGIDTFPGHRFRIIGDGQASIPQEVSIKSGGDVTCHTVDGRLQCGGAPLDEVGFVPEADDESARAYYTPRDASIDIEYAGTEVARLSWIDSNDGSRVFVQEIRKADGRISQKTRTGHSFEVTGPGFQSQFQIANAGGVGIAADGRVSGKAIENFAAIYKGPRWKAIVKAYRAKCFDAWGDHNRSKDYFCHPMHDYRILNTAKFDYPSDDDFRKWMKPMDEAQAAKVKYQAQKFQNFTKVGFKVIKIPSDLHQKLLNYYRQHKWEAIPEPNIEYDNPGLEGRTHDTWLLNLPKELKQEAFEWVKDMVANWAKTPAEGLRSTSLYGLRYYHHDAVLGVHVDIEETHALSAILEVARNDPDDTEPWPLQISDHKGEVHRVPYKAGQLILYESATCGHGRPSPFPGRQMVNAFVHFAPEGWPSKYLSSAPPATSEGYRSDRLEL